ncbi:unnamed protein product [Gongylonema pulchrum]|uniref:C2H2-type domain-containing protein n=1 Tax=Gongylonema pulchrum TaxID=637853 RepID=A0A183DVH0_9BILA|nr:unnamed protein product [Gongylonema pulchrum]
MVNCAATYSSPPKVCTYCTEEYVALKHMEYHLHKLGYACVIIDWKFETNSTEYSYHNNTVEFQNKLYAWRRCVSNYSSALRTNRSVICDECMNLFNALFEFYWDIYVAPHVDFCLDVETTMNDTTNLWHNVWHCPDDRVEERRDWTLLGYSLAFLAIITVFFYTGSYMQSEEIQRRLVQCLFFFFC